jgi:hypothetical protein
MCFIAKLATELEDALKTSLEIFDLLAKDVLSKLADRLGFVMMPSSTTILQKWLQ